MCADNFHDPDEPTPLRRFARALFFLALVFGLLAALFLLAPEAPATDPLLRSVW